MAQIVIEVSDEAKTLLEEAAKHYGFPDAAAHAKEWMKNNMITYRHQLHDVAQQKVKAKVQRGVEAIFEE